MSVDARERECLDEFLLLFNICVCAETNTHREREKKKKEREMAGFISS